MEKGKFIVFEGPDGSGQSTQAELLANYLREKGRTVLLTKEPTTRTKLGRRIRSALRGKIKISPTELQELFIKDRKEHLETLVLPTLRRGEIVISDRYFFSTIAYGSLECDEEWLARINKEFPVPDLTLILIVRPEVCLRRIEKRGGGREFFEGAEKLRQVLKVYQDFPKRYQHVYVIDGERPVEEVLSEVKKKVDAIL